ncbi:MAG: restriction endonuclease subunit S [Lachnospiraceae bacterium]|nr:restriction endonuclease subunit S [Lachnospiraceae bacterium]
MFGDPATPGQRYPTDKLGNVACVKSSHRVFTTEFVEKGVPFFRGTEIGILAEGEIPQDPFYITEKKYNELASDESKPMVGDLLMPSICNKGQVWMVNTEKPFYYKDGRVLCISPNRDIFNPKYLQYYMKIRTEIEYPKLGSGSTFAEFKIFQLKELEVDLPPKYMQESFTNFVQQVDKSKLDIRKVIREAQLVTNPFYINIF